MAYTLSPVICEEQTHTTRGHDDTVQIQRQSRKGCKVRELSLTDDTLLTNIQRQKYTNRHRLIVTTPSREPVTVRPYPCAVPCLRIVSLSNTSKYTAKGPLRHAALPDNYRLQIITKTFPLMKCVRRCV